MQDLIIGHRLLDLEQGALEGLEGLEGHVHRERDHFKLTDGVGLGWVLKANWEWKADSSHLVHSVTS